MKARFFFSDNNIKKSILAGLTIVGLFSLRIPVAQAFEYYADSRELTIKQGMTGQTRVEINRDGASGPVTFSIDSAVSARTGITVSTSPNPITNTAASFYANVIFSVAANAPLPTGQQLIRVTGRAGTASKVESFYITVKKGSATAALTASPTSVAFAASMIGQTPAFQTLTLRNSGTGTGTLDISSIGLSGADAASFAMNTTACNGARLAAGGSCAVTLTAAAPAMARAYNATITVNTNVGASTIPVVMQGTDYILTVSPASVALSPGGNATVTVTANRNMNTAAAVTGAINVSVSGLPSGVTAGSLSIPAGSSSGTLSLNATAAAPRTSTPATVTYTGNLSGRTKTATNTVNVQTAGTFTLSATPNPVSITQGQSRSVTVNIIRSTFTSSVALALTGASGGPLPTGVSANAPSTTATSASLNISTLATTAAGTYTLNIRGTGGSGSTAVTQTIPVVLTVVALPADFSMSVSPSSITLTPGAATPTNFTVNLNRTNFTGNVTFTLSGLPSGVSASCDASTGASAACRASAPTGTASANATVTIQGTNGSTLTKTASLNLRVGESEGLRAFPGAEGFGANVTGGRGGVVCKVTNVNASGAGSLQACLDLTQPAYVVFAIPAAANDTIIDRSIECHQGNKTIAGQTATRGIMVREFIADNVYENNMACRNYIIRHMKFRADAGLRAKSGDFYGDTVRLDGARDFIIDHASIARSNDEAFQLSRATNITVQNSILAETLSDHYWGGMLINYSNQNADLNGLSIHHNMWTGIRARFPEITCEENSDGTPNHDGAGHLQPSNCTNKRLQIELSNNFIFDPSDPIYYNRCTATNGGNDCAPSDPSFFVDMNFVGNYMRARTGFTNPMIVSNLASETRNDVFYGDNYLDVGTAAIFNLPVLNLAGRFDYPEITYTPGNDIENYMEANVGAFPRDAMDQRLVGYLNQNINSTPTATNAAARGNDTFNLPAASCTGPLVGANDSDNDGMNDNWERRHGLNVGVADHNGSNLSSEGYTNIEVYLNELSDRVIAAGSNTSGVCD